MIEGAEVFCMSGFSLTQATEAQALWDVKALRATYAGALKRLAASEARLSRLSPEAGARESLLLGREVIAQIVRDPLLPEEILQGDERPRLVAAMTAYQARSFAIWADVLGSEGLIG
jgi:phenylacetic acid degradation operon negative regulatory protein